VGKRSRQRARVAGPPAGDLSAAAPASYSDPEAGELELRTKLTPKARSEYSALLAGGGSREDTWQRAIELLFERLAVSWTIAGVRTSNQRELLARYRLASQDERRFVRDSLRAHVAANFPELQAP